MDYMNQAEYAKHRGVSAAAVNKAIKSGRIIPVEDENGRKFIDPVVADRQWQQNSSPVNGGDRRKKDKPLFFAEPEPVKIKPKIQGKLPANQLTGEDSQLTDQQRYLRARAEEKEIARDTAKFALGEKLKQYIPIKPVLGLIESGNKRSINLVQDVCRLVAPRHVQMDDQKEIQAFLLAEFKRAFDELPALDMEKIDEL